MCTGPQRHSRHGNKHIQCFCMNRSIVVKVDDVILLNLTVFNSKEKAKANFEKEV